MGSLQTAFGTLTNQGRVGMDCRPCPYCGKEHKIVCPRIAKIVWAEKDSIISEVELHSPETK